MSTEKEQLQTKTTRKSLKTLQHAATDIENLVGRPTKNLKHQLLQDSPVDIEIKRKIVTSKETQANLDAKITAKDLTSTEGPSEKYWEILADKRLVALQEALDENEKLHKIIEDLREENKQYKQMLDEANSFVEVIKEELENATNNDTGIDVNDFTADDTIEESENAEDSKTE